MSEKSFNIVAAELLELVKTGWGIHQACRQVGINNSELLVCLNKNEELASVCKSRFGIEANGTGIKTDKEEDELAALRAKAETMGIKVHPQMGVKKLRKLIDDAESDKPDGEEQPADETPVLATAEVVKDESDTETPSETSENQGSESENTENGTAQNTEAA